MKLTATELLGALVSELAYWHRAEKKQELIDLYNKIWYDEHLTIDEVDWEN